MPLSRHDKGHFQTVLLLFLEHMKPVALTILAVATVSAGDLTGTWAGKFEARKNQTQDIVFRLVQEGTAVKGKLYGDTEDLTISTGSISGNDVRLVIDTEGYGGKYQLIFTGTLKNGELHLTRTREDAVTRSGAEPKRPGQDFVLKKML